jgi:hypothetical protein
MSVINCYYIIDATYSCLFEQVSVSDTGGLNVKYFQISGVLPQYKFIPHSQHFLYIAVSVNHLDWNEWLNEGNCHFKYVYLLKSSQIETVVSDNA